MNSIVQQLQKDKTGWQSCLKLAVFLAIATVLAGASTAIPVWIGRLSENVSGVGVILVKALELLLGLWFLILVIYLLYWTVTEFLPALHIKPRRDRRDPYREMPPILKKGIGPFDLLKFLTIPILFWITEMMDAPNIGPVHWVAAGLFIASAPYGLLVLAYIMILHFKIIATKKRGDYDQALWYVQVTEKIFMHLRIYPRMYLDMHSRILFQTGHYKEAERVLCTRTIEAHQKTPEAGSASTLNTLGYALMGQGRSEEAIKVFESAITLEPDEGAAYDNLAEVYLSQGIETDRVLELLDCALVRYQPSLKLRRFIPRSLSMAWAGRAWALARLGRHAEAAESLEKAFALAPHKHNADFAEILYRAGHALALLGETRKAAEHFAEAQRLDPHGHYGRLCAAAARLQE